MSASARAVYALLLREIHKEVPGGRFDPAQIRAAVETASRATGAVPLHSAAKAATKKQALSLGAARRKRKPQPSRGHSTGAVAKKR